jgi:hypothetical protein
MKPYIDKSDGMLHAKDLINDLIHDMTREYKNRAKNDSVQLF